MNKQVYAELEKEIFEDLRVELNTDDDFNEDILAVKVRSVIREVIGIRGYIRAGYTDDMVSADLWNFQSQIMNIARYDYNAIGAEGEISHTDSGVSRTWIGRDSLFGGIVPLAIY